MHYEAVIGLEIHAELNTKTKMFCYSLNDPDEKHPNINICPICMGHPGTLPFINEDAVKKVIMVGLAVNGTIGEFSQFDRKNYFYPDLPKGYQISQYKYPIVSGGYLEFPISNFQFPNKIKNQNTQTDIKKIRITRIHLEEDTGRLVHDKETGASLVDFNRAGVPLMELVTEPDFRTGEEVRAFGEALQQIVRYVGASDANMEKGQMRVEVNISMRPVGIKEFGTKVEVKNINSFKYAADAVEYETKRQIGLLEAGEKIMQETRGWNEHKGISVSQRSKEEAHDYRYFPEPDLPPLRLTAAYVEEIRIRLPELPAAKQERFIKEYGIDADQAEIIVREKQIADYCEAAISEAWQHDKESAAQPKKNLAKAIAAFMVGDFMRLLKETGVPPAEVLLTPENFAEVVVLLSENKISNTTAKEVFEESFRTGANPTNIINEKGLWQMSDTGDLENIVAHIVAENPKIAGDYRSGKTAVLQFLVGQVMKETRGKANPALVQEIMKKLLG